MIVNTYVLDGYAASFRDYATHDFVIDCIQQILVTDGVYYKYNFYKSSLGCPKRKIRKSILSNQCNDNILLLVGKSYGAKIIVNDIINNSALYNLNYKYIYMFTIEPNWPKLFSFAPNLNDQPLYLDTKNNIIATNVYIKSDNKRKQCGSPLYNLSTKFLPIKNIRIQDDGNVNHNNIICNNITKIEFKKLLCSIRNIDSKI